MNRLLRWLRRSTLIQKLTDLPFMLRLARRTMMAELDRYERELRQQARYDGPRNLIRHEFQVFSQGGEDGVLAEIFRRLGGEPRRFVEIGVGNGLENNTAYLLQLGWQGHWVEASEQHLEAIRRHFARPIAEGKLCLRPCFVTAENIAAELAAAGVQTEFDLLSLDIDRNTYYVWKALSALRPRAVVVEYNAAYPPQADWKVEYRADGVWNGSSHWGASLKAFELLGRELGYSLVGCSLNGVNAFFVRSDLCGDLFEEPFTAEHHFEPPRYYLARRPGYPAGFSD